MLPMKPTELLPCPLDSSTTRGKAEHVEEAAVEVDGAADVAPAEALPEIMLVVVRGLRLPGKIVGELVGCASPQGRRVRSGSEIERRLHRPAGDQGLGEISGEIVGVALAGKQAQLLVGMERHPGGLCAGGVAGSAVLGTHKISRRLRAVVGEVHRAL